MAPRIGSSRTLALSVLTGVVCLSLSASLSAAGEAKATQPEPARMTPRVLAQMIKAAVRSCVLGEHSLCDARMSALSNLFRGAPPSAAGTGGMSVKSPTRPPEVRVGMFKHPTAPAFHRLSALVKSGTCDVTNRQWRAATAGGAAASPTNEEITLLIRQAEEELSDSGPWPDETRELHEMRQTIEACLQGRPTI